MKKIQMVMLVAIAAFMVMPVVSALEISSYGKVTDITPNGEHMATYETPIEGEADATNQLTTFEIENKDLKVIDENKGEEERPVKDATWFGIAVKAPEYSDGDLTKACWVRAGESTCREDSDAVVDGEGGTYTLWVPITSQELKDIIKSNGEGAVLSKTVQLQWEGKDSQNNIQTVVINIHTDSVTLTIDPDAAPGEIEATAKFDEEDEQAAIEEYKENHPDTPATENQEQSEQQPEKNADTADINLGLLLSIIAVSTLGLGYTFKKRFN